MLEFIKFKKRLLSLTGTMTLHVGALIMMRQMIPLYLEDIGTSPELIGVVTSLFSFLPLLIALPGGAITDIIGHRFMMAFGAACMVATGAVLGTLPGLILVIATQLIAGLGHRLLIISFDAYVANLSSPEERAQNFSIALAGPCIGMLIAPPLAGFLKDTFGYPAAFFTGAIVAGVVTLLCLRVRELSETGLEPGRSLTNAIKRQMPEMLKEGSRLLKIPIIQTLTGISILTLLVMTLRTSFLIIHLENVGLSAFYIGVVVATVPAMSAIFRPLMATLVDRLGAEIVMIITFFISGCGLTLMATTESLSRLLIGGACFGLGHAFIGPICLTLMSENSPQESQGTTMGLRQALNPIGLMAGPLLFGAIVSYGGTALSLVVAAGLFFVMGTVLLVFRPVTRYAGEDVRYM